MERDGGIVGPRNRCAVRFEFQCAAGGNAVIIGPGIGYCVNFGYVFASKEYPYYGNCVHGIGVLLEVAQGNDTVAVLLNGRNVALVRVNKDDVDNGCDSAAEGRLQQGR